jgi:hypothetical protein
MKKIPTLFERQFDGHKIVGITDKITPGCEEAFLHGEATVKYDGSCCALLHDKFYKRYDARRGKEPPEDAIPCCDPDPITGHWPHWVEVDPSNPADKWFAEALSNTQKFGDIILWPGTYEAIGPHFQGNPYGLQDDILIKHGINSVWVKRDFESVKTFLTENDIEGLVFWLNGEPVCKIKRSDFGLPWNSKGGSKK